MVLNQKKAEKIRRALGKAARLPIRVSGGRGSGRSNFSPLNGEQPVVLLRLQVLSCKDLLAKDKNGFSDPFVVVSVLNTRHSTPVSKRTCNPTFNAKDATFDFPIYKSLAEKYGAVELVVWDKDMLKKEYLGEIAIPLDHWFHNNETAFGFHDANNQPFTSSIVSTRASTSASGVIEIKLGFVSPYAQTPVDFQILFTDLIKNSRPSVTSVPPTESVGTVRSHQGGPAFEDDGGISSDDDEGEDEEDTITPLLSQMFIETYPVSPATPSTPDFLGQTPHTEKMSSLSEVIPQHLESPTTPTPTPLIRSPVATKPSTTGFIPKIFPRRSNTSTSLTSNEASSPSSPVGSSPPTPRPGHQRTMSESQPGGGKKGFKKAFSNKKVDYNFSAANDIVGIVMLEIQGATDLPRLKNITRTGWDMDPFVVISFGKKVFRTRVIRHSRNPVWDEKLLFHVRRYETAFKAQLTVLDWDKLSSNDHVGDASFEIAELLANAPQRDPLTGLYAANEDGHHAMTEFKVPLSTAKEMPWESKHNPVITFRAKYQPYDGLRQQFWRQYLKQYDTDDTGTMSHLELTSMLDSLGSTLSRSTVNAFFTRHGKNAKEDELTIEEAIICLEGELKKPNSEKKLLESDDSLPNTSVPATPNFMGSDPMEKFSLAELDFSGPAADSTLKSDWAPVSNALPTTSHKYTTEPNEQPLIEAAQASNLSTPAITLSIATDTNNKMDRQESMSSSDAEESSGSGGSGGDDAFERVINVKNCPLCHRPRLNKKAEMDIVTHLAVCASQDWATVDKIVVGNYVTASQAQRKWYTKVISKVSSGDYRLGANSANIIVQNRMTGQLEEEKMQVYVRLGIRLLYKGAKSRMEGARARRLLKSLSIKQGLKYDSPESALEIPTFIEFHKLVVSEIQDPLDSFKTFNQFFYRKLKPSARPVESPDDPYRLVSGADCRMMAFETVNEATRLWIKGREFTVARLLGDGYRGQAEKYVDGALAIFRLAPQDYHRFHSPVGGKIGPMTYIAGEYYTVNPQAIRTTLDVYGENARKIVPIDSPQFGRVMAVCIGAMMVGSIKTTVEEGDVVERGQEFGYFAFGGSTIVLLFEKGVVEWDEDLLINGRASLETLVRVGMGIGRGRRT